jgi:phosphinothricin acetyltransferase
MGDEYSIEPMTPEHRRSVIDIFNFYAENSFAAFPESAVPYEFFDKLIESNGEYPAVVIRDNAGAVAGFAFMHRYYSDETLRRTAEVDYFLMPHLTRRGIGSAILNLFTERAKLMGIDNFLACISSLNREGIEFHRKHGFAECGRMLAVGCKFGRDFDIVWMQKRI